MGILLFMNFVGIQSQEVQYKRWNVKGVKTSFELPAHWKILENKGDEFRAKDPNDPCNSILRMGPFRDPNIDAKGVGMYGWDYKYEANNKEVPTSNKKIEMEKLVPTEGTPGLDQYEVYVIWGYLTLGSKADQNIAAFVAGFNKKNSPDNIFFRLTLNQKNMKDGCTEATLNKVGNDFDKIIASVKPL